MNLDVMAKMFGGGQAEKIIAAVIKQQAAQPGKVEGVTCELLGVVIGAMPPEHPMIPILKDAQAKIAALPKG